jgi:hypothetical protein
LDVAEKAIWATEKHRRKPKRVKRITQRAQRVQKLIARVKS